MLVDIKRPVPSDIDIAQAAIMRPIIDVAHEVGLTEDDLDFHGKYKAKVHLTCWSGWKACPTASIST